MSNEYDGLPALCASSAVSVCQDVSLRKPEIMQAVRELGLNWRTNAGHDSVISVNYCPDPGGGVNLEVGNVLSQLCQHCTTGNTSTASGNSVVWTGDGDDRPPSWPSWNNGDPAGYQSTSRGDMEIVSEETEMKESCVDPMQCMATNTIECNGGESSDQIVVNELIVDTMQHETVEASEFKGNFSEVVKLDDSCFNALNVVWSLDGPGVSDGSVSAVKQDADALMPVGSWSCCGKQGDIAHEASRSTPAMTFNVCDSGDVMEDHVVVTSSFIEVDGVNNVSSAVDNSESACVLGITEVQAAIRDENVYAAGMESVLLSDDSANCITCVSQDANLLRTADSGVDIVTGLGREFVEAASCEDTGEVVNVVRNGDDSVSNERLDADGVLNPEIFCDVPRAISLWTKLSDVTRVSDTDVQTTSRTLSSILNDSSLEKRQCESEKETEMKRPEITEVVASRNGEDECISDSDLSEWETEDEDMENNAVGEALACLQSRVVNTAISTHACEDDVELTVENIIQSQEEDGDLRIILHAKKAAKDKPPWDEVASLSPGAKALWHQWESEVMSAEPKWNEPRRCLVEGCAQLLSHAASLKRHLKSKHPDFILPVSTPKSPGNRGRSRSRKITAASRTTEPGAESCSAHGSRERNLDSPIRTSGLCTPLREGAKTGDYIPRIVVSAADILSRANPPLDAGGLGHARSQVDTHLAARVAQIKASTAPPVGKVTDEQLIEASYVVTGAGPGSSLTFLVRTLTGPQYQLPVDVARGIAIGGRIAAYYVAKLKDRSHDNERRSSRDIDIEEQSREKEFRLWSTYPELGMDDWGALDDPQRECQSSEFIHGSRYRGMEECGTAGQVLSLTTAEEQRIHELWRDTFGDDISQPLPMTKYSKEPVKPKPSAAAGSEEQLSQGKNLQAMKDVMMIGSESDADNESIHSVESDDEVGEMSEQLDDGVNDEMSDRGSEGPSGEEKQTKEVKMTKEEMKVSESQQKAASVKKNSPGTEPIKQKDSDVVRELLSRVTHVGILTGTDPGDENRPDKSDTGDDGAVPRPDCRLAVVSDRPETLKVG